MQTAETAVPQGIALRHLVFHFFCIIAAIAMCGMVGYKMYDTLRAKSQVETMRYLSQLRYFQDTRRSGLCFGVNERDGGITSAPCQEVELEDCLNWISNKIWFFQEQRRGGTCYAALRHHGALQAVPVPCDAVRQFFDSADSRWRYEDWDRDTN